MKQNQKMTPTCPFCNKEVTGFKDSLSLREFEISGLCQKCQDETFKDVVNDKEILNILAMEENFNKIKHRLEHKNVKKKRMI